MLVLQHYHATETKSTLKNLRIAALGNRKWFFNYQWKNCLQILRFFVEDYANMLFQTHKNL